MKESYYNFVYPMEGKPKRYVAYNSFSNAMAIISQRELEQIKKCEELSMQDNKDVWSDFINNGFVVEDEVDERALIRERMLQCRYYDRQLSLTIAPTLDCNFRCIYCYEKGCEKGTVMSEDTCDKIKEFVELRAKEIKRLSVTWYGGEPLLAINVIEKLTCSFQEICEANAIHYSATMITNGFLLNEKMLERILSCKIGFVQITLDGNRESHNYRRPHANGCDTYDVIIRNAKKASERISVSVRVNIDKTNEAAIEDVSKAFSDTKSGNIMVYPAPVQNEDGCYTMNECFNNEEFLKCQGKYFTAKNDLKFAMSKYPKLVGNSCCADNISSFVVAPNGDLYKCWTDIGKEAYRIGNICEKEFNQNRAIRYSKYDATNDVKCSKCKFLPICMGGCPREATAKKDDRCNYIMTVHQNYIVNVAELLAKNDV